MALSRTSDLLRTTPTPPRLIIPTGDQKILNLKSELFLQRDQKADQYQIRRFGDSAVGSALSFQNWRPVDYVPTELVESQFPASPGQVSETGPASNRLRHQKRLLRFAAWIKRSGKGLVLRLRRQNDRSAVDFTDVHLVSDDFGHQNSATSPIVELMSSAIEEIGASTPVSELESPHHHVYSRIARRHELPVYELTDADPSSELPGSFVGQLVDMAEYDDIRSPGDTVGTDLSTADTAVGGSESPILEEPEVLSLASQPLARGLTVSKTVHYRCESHRDFEPASPNEIIRLVSKSPFQGQRERRGTRRKAAAAEGTWSPTHGLLLSAKATTPASTALAEGVQQSSRSIIDRPQLASNVDDRREHTLYGMTTSACFYRQDLHGVQAQTFSTHFVSLPDRFPDKSERFNSLLEHFEVPGKPTPIDIVTDTVSKTAEERKENESATKPMTHGNDVRVVEIERESLRNEQPPTSEVQKSSSALIDMPLGTSTREQDDTKRQTDHPQHLVSPMSPVSAGEKHRNSSTTSAFVPVTPMTPEQPTRPGYLPRDRSGIPLCESMMQHVVPDGSSGPQPLGEAHDATDVNRNNVSQLKTRTTTQDTQAVESLEAQGQEKASVAEDVKEVNLPDFGIKHLADLVDYQQSPAPVEEMQIPPLGFLSDEKVPARYKNARFNTILQIDTSVRDRSQPQVVVPDPVSSGTPEEFIQNTGRALPETRGILRDTSALLVSGATTALMRGALWMQRHAGQEPPVPEGHVRIRWTCTCGSQLFDDFRELRPGAASRLEAVLNKERPHPYSVPSGGARGSQSSLSHTPGSSSQHSSSATSWSNGSAGYDVPSGYPYRATPRSSRTPSYQVFPTLPQQYLLTCINEARNTPKVFNLPLHEQPIRTDAQLADAIQERYRKVNAPWYRWFRLRGLTSIEFVQFYMHKNRFADIRMRPAVPKGALSQNYEFDPSDTLPPVGGQYLLHLFRHPHEYDSETVAYTSVPKKHDRLDYGIGWGIVLTEGFLPERIWLLIFFTLILFACVFGVVWSVKKNDLQGAFGVASFITTLASVVVEIAQACLG